MQAQIMVRDALNQRRRDITPIPVPVPPLYSIIITVVSVGTPCHAIYGLHACCLLMASDKERPPIEARRPLEEDATLCF